MCYQINGDSSVNHLILLWSVRQGVWWVIPISDIKGKLRNSFVFSVRKVWIDTQLILDLIKESSKIREQVLKSFSLNTTVTWEKFFAKIFKTKYWTNGLRTPNIRINKFKWLICPLIDLIGKAHDDVFSFNVTRFRDDNWPNLRTNFLKTYKIGMGWPNWWYRSSKEV